MGSNPEAFESDPNMQINKSLEKIKHKMNEYSKNIGKSIQQLTGNKNPLLLELQIMYYNFVYNDKKQMQ